MAPAVHPYLPKHISSTPISTFKFKWKPSHVSFPSRSLPIKPYCNNPIKCSVPSPPRPLASIKPFVQSEWQPILHGWIWSAVSVYSLSKIVPRVGKLTGTGAAQLRGEVLVIGFLLTVRSVAHYMQQALLWEASLRSVYKIRVHVFDNVLKRDLRFFEGGCGALSGDVAYRVTAEASDVADTIYALLSTIVPSMLQLSVMAIQMLVISPILSLVSALVIPLMGLLIAYLGEKLRKISTIANVSAAALSAYLNEVLPSIFFVKANNAENCESTRFKGLAHADLSEYLKKKKMKALVPQVVQMICCGVLLMIFFGSLTASSETFDCAGVVSFITSLILLLEPIQDVGKAYNELKQGEPAIDRLFQLSMVEYKVIEELDAVDMDSVAGEVQFCQVSFTYEEGKAFVLNELNLHIRAGETVALVGPSGGGKTTLVKLLLRLYDPLSGCILIDNHDIRSLPLGSLRTHVGLVTQDVVLFSGTVAENIGYKDLMTKIDMERVKVAAQQANAAEFIETLSEKYATNIGPRGSLLSGGQRQRLAIARALYQNPSILILDEATSALDSRSELLVRQALQRLMENRTVIVIAHRLETVQMADRVLLLKDGRLQELCRSSIQYDSLASGALLI